MSLSRVARRCATGVFVVALCVGLAPWAVADDLFGPAEKDKKPQPWFGNTVDEIYVNARDSIVVPAIDAAARVLADPAVQTWVDRAQSVARDLTEAAAGIAAERAPELPSFFSLTAGPGALPNEMQRPFAAPVPVVEADSLPNRDAFDDRNRPDPLEPFNRVMFAFNNGLRSAIFDPVINAYHRHATPAVQTNVHNFFANLREPVTIVSNLLEGRVGGATNAAARFSINTVIGVAGFGDPATRMGFPAQPRNLEQTFCNYRIPSGPYVVLPLFGPATARDAVARIATNVAYYQALGGGIYITYRVTDVGLQYGETRERLRMIDALSLDPYLAQRRAYLATRRLDCGLQAIANQDMFAK